MFFCTFLQIGSIFNRGEYKEDMWFQWNLGNHSTRLFKKALGKSTLFGSFGLLRMHFPIFMKIVKYIYSNVDLLIVANLYSVDKKLNTPKNS